MTDFSEFLTPNIQHLLNKITTDIHLVTENTLLLRFNTKKQFKNLNSSDKIENFYESLPHLISAFKAYLIKDINIDTTIIVDTISSYDSLVIVFDLEIIYGEKVKQTIEKKINIILSSIDKISQLAKDNTIDESELSKQIISVPTYYGLDVGWDLQNFSEEMKLSTEEIITLHSEKTYIVCAIGFSPGFAYMGFVPPQIQKKRLSIPRTKVFPGSIGIAEEQTGIYPNMSPGGWNIIGRTPIKMIDLDNTKKPSFFTIGDTVRFEPIDKQSYLNLGGEINTL